MIAVQDIDVQTDILIMKEHAAKNKIHVFLTDTTYILHVKHKCYKKLYIPVM
jgi:hypothetical protein